MNLKNHGIIEMTKTARGHLHGALYSCKLEAEVPPRDLTNVV